MLTTKKTMLLCLTERDMTSKGEKRKTIITHLLSNRKWKCTYSNKKFLSRKCKELVALAINIFLYKSVGLLDWTPKKKWTIIDFDATITLDSEVVDEKIMIHRNNKEKKGVKVHHRKYYHRNWKQNLCWQNNKKENGIYHNL